MKIFIAFCLLLMPSFLFAQWQGTNPVYFNAGNVSIGTSTPRGKLDVDGPGDIYLADDVNLGTNQSVFLPGHIYISPFYGSNVSYLQARRYNNSGTTSLRIRTYNSGALTEAVHIEGNGNVGIGTTNPGTFKLAVSGKIAANEEVRVFISGTTVFPDYVFDPSYKLPKLEETEKYIKENRHLPEVPTAADIDKNGMSLNDMNVILLKKVEELTLYMIEMKKENKELKERIEKIENKK